MYIGGLKVLVSNLLMESLHVSRRLAFYVFPVTYKHVTIEKGLVMEELSNTHSFLFHLICYNHIPYRIAPLKHLSLILDSSSKIAHGHNYQVYDLAFGF